MMTHSTQKSKRYSLSNDGFLSQKGLSEAIMSLSASIIRGPLRLTLLSAFEYATATKNILCFKSLQNIADSSGLSRDTVRRHLAHMTKIGLLKRSEVYEREGGRQRPCLYEFSEFFIDSATAFRKSADQIPTKSSPAYKDAVHEFNAKIKSRLMKSNGPVPVDNSENLASNHPDSATPDGSQKITRSVNKTSDQIIKNNIRKNAQKKVKKEKAKSNKPSAPRIFFDDLMKRVTAGIKARKSAKFTDRQTAIPATNIPQTSRTTHNSKYEGYVGRIPKTSLSKNSGHTPEHDKIFGSGYNKTKKRCSFNDMAFSVPLGNYA